VSGLRGKPVFARNIPGLIISGVGSFAAIDIVIFFLQDVTGQSGCKACSTATYQV
jgi:hypothetical protein